MGFKNTKMTMTINNLVDILGFTAAVLAYIIAIYLQIYVRKRIKAKYVLGFIWLGTALFLITLNTNLITDADLTYLKAIGYTIFILGELYGLRTALEDIDVKTTLTP